MDPVQHAYRDNAIDPDKDSRVGHGGVLVQLDEFDIQRGRTRLNAKANAHVIGIGKFLFGPQEMHHCEACLRSATCLGLPSGARCSVI